MPPGEYAPGSTQSGPCTGSHAAGSPAAASAICRYIFSLAVRGTTCEYSSGQLPRIPALNTHRGAFPKASGCEPDAVESIGPALLVVALSARHAVGSLALQLETRQRPSDALTTEHCNPKFRI